MTTAGRSDIDIHDLTDGAPRGAPDGPQDNGRPSPPIVSAQGFARFAGGLWTLFGQERALQAQRWLLWTPVAFGLGCAAELSWPTEPSLLGLGLLASLGVAAATAVRVMGRRPGLFILLAFVALSLCGAAVTKLRTDNAAAPILPVQSAGAVTVRGYVVDVLSPGATGGRILLAPVRISGLSSDQLPLRVRLTLRGTGLAALGGAAPGDAVSVRAILNAPPPPASPGAYDFARNAYFDGIGGSGFALGPARPIWLEPPPARLGLVLRINALRWALSSRLVEIMGEREGGVAAAMVSGHEAWLEPDLVEEMRAAGLAHILSISGLHMAIVGGFAFFAARGVIAAIPWLALRINGKKAAAVFGLTAVGLYLVLSGAPAPAERAAITAALAFIAILADRRALTLHGLAVAALIVLALQPEAVAEPGFQMSFAATAALVALAEVWPRTVKEINSPWPIRLVQWAATGLLASLVASLVAGLATGPFAIQHFNRVATYGLLANLISEPLTGFIIMPFLTVGALLAPLGWGGPVLMVAEGGIAALSGLSARFADLPGAMMLLPSAPTVALPVAFVGLLWICLWRGRLRWLGVPAALAVSLWPRPPAPDVWISSDGSNAAYRQGQAAVLVQTQAKRFGADLWARRRGLTVNEYLAFTCSGRVCRAPSDAPVALSLWKGNKAPTADQWDALCLDAEVVVVRVRVSVPDRCRADLVLTGRDLERSGAVELWHRQGGWQWQQAQVLRGQRPWTGS